MSFKRHIPNIVTLLNLFSGCIALVFAVNGNFIAAAIFAWLSIFSISSEETFKNRPIGKLRNKKPTLIFAALGGMLAAAGSGALTNFLTSSAEDTGLSPSKAGILLSVAAFVGVTVRLASGIIADKKPHLKPVKVAGLLLFIGGFGTIALGLRDP